MRKFWIIWDLLGLMWCTGWMAFDIMEKNAAGATVQGVFGLLCVVSLIFLVVTE